MKILVVLFVMLIGFSVFAETTVEERLASAEAKIVQLEQTISHIIVPKCQLVARYGGTGMGWCPAGNFINSIRSMSIFNNNITLWTDCQYYELVCK